ncbi:MAG: MFS transporter [Dehalococcoidia bacterium]|nr:MFS transporter [Dehalococcoidia bacterium]
MSTDSEASRGEPEASVAPGVTNADDHYPRYRWVIVSQMIVQQQFGPVVFSSLGVLLPSMREELHFGIIESGWLGSARTVGNLMVFVASIVLVRFGPIRMFNAFALVLATALLMVGFAPTYYVALAGLALYSFGVSFGQIPANMIRQQWIAPREMATVAGVMLSLQTVAQIAGLALVPLILVAVGGWRHIFIGNATVLMGIAVLWFFTARERISPSYERARRQDRGLSAAGAVLRRREFYLLGFAVLGGATAFTTNLLFLPSYFVDERGFSLQTAGSITAVIPLGGLFINGVAGFISDRIGLRKPLIWPSGFALPVLWFVMLMPLEPWMLIVVAFVTGCFVFLPFPSLQTMPLEIPGLSPAERAIGQALQQTISFVGILAGPIIVSTIADHTGSYRSGLLPLLLLPTLFIWTSFFMHETGARRRQPTTT